MDLDAFPTFAPPLEQYARRGTASVGPTSAPATIAERIAGKLEWLTLAIAFVIHGGFIALTLFFNNLPLWLAAPAGALLLAWYGSLQHETIHGHPTTSRRFNRLLGALPLSVWIPYGVYRETHLRHHRYRGRHLTEAEHDPESYYLPAGTMAKAGRLKRWIYNANCTLAGRLIVGPAISIATFWTSEWRLILNGDRRRLRIWLQHALAVAFVLTWVVAVCHVSAAIYLALVVYPSVAVTQLRSFAEHHAHPDPRQRTRVVEAHPFWALIFLNNNLHIAHHAYPKLPWYELPAAWREAPAYARTERLTFQGGYWEVMRRYLFRRFI